ncbi:hypothetical protein [Paludisphaera rhizosphaerae]|uniref:hypothetical protein n=1 Tax=Paludisphaera rhizosphaerae TaxID=2711216 RepID=UPI0013ECB793|nr:hypothetical protein [Paludisphaera rhizosphaerae]
MTASERETGRTRPDVGRHPPPESDCSHGAGAGHVDGASVLTPTELGGVDYAIEAPEPTTLAMPAPLSAPALGRRRAG